MIFIDPGLIIVFASLKGTPMSNRAEVPTDNPEKFGRAIKVVLAQQYGQEVIRPVCPDAELFCEIAGTKTLTRRMIHQIKSLGYRVEVVPTEPKEL